MQGKKIILGVSGGIAAYKACDLASLLTKAGAHVHCVLSQSASQFITPLALKTITYHKVYNDQFNYEIVEPLHIELCRQADLMLLAPATANIIAKLATGICDDLLSTTACAFAGPVLVAPAMNTEMWQNKIVQENVGKLKDKLGYHFIDPIEGELACRTVGIGKLANVEDIFNRATSILNSKNKISAGGSQSSQKALSGIKVLITAGGTREPIDPVRFIGNRSSGKTGLEIADAAHELGAKVILITTQENLKRDYQIIEVETAHELQRSVEQYFDTSNILIMSAAVSDFRPIEFYPSKVKKSADSDWNLPLTKNPDILETLGHLKKPEQLLIGFAAESDDLISNAKQKLKNKKLDLIVANEITKEGIGFQSDFNEVYLLTKGSKQATVFSKNTKKEIAKQLWNFVIAEFANSPIFASQTLNATKKTSK